MKTLQIFENIALGAKVRTIVEDSQVFFCASDVAKALGYAVPKDAVSAHCEGAVKRRSPTDGGGEQEMNYILEPDLYRLIFGSKLESAKKFQDWIFSDVLPSIRKTGSYTAIADIQQEVDMIRSVSDALGIGDQGRLLASYYGKVPMSNGQKELAQDLIAKSDIAINRSAMEIMQPRKDELILQLENKIVEKTTHTLTVSGIANQFPAKGVTSSKVIEALLYGKYIVPIKSNNSSSLYAPTNKGLEFCTPSAISIGVNKNIEVAKNWQYRDELKQDLESYLCIFV